MSTADNITIRYERIGRCFWHIGCKARHHSPPMRVATFKEQDRTAVYCVVCGEGGLFPHGRVGDVCCERIPSLGVAVPAGEVVSQQPPMAPSKAAS